MKLTKLIALGTFALIVAVSLFGYDTVKSHLGTLRGEVTSGVRELTPDNYEEKRIQRLISDMSRKIMAYRDKLDDLSAKLATEQKDIDQLENQNDSDRVTLASEREMLKQQADTYDIHGTSFTHQQVEASASARLSRCRTTAASLGTKRQVAVHLTAALAEGRARLDQAVVARDEQLHQLELLRARLDNARLQKEIADLSEPLRDAALRDVDSELANSMQAFEDRIRGLERETVLSRPVTTAPQIIAHTDEEPTGLVQALDDFLESETSDTEL